MVVPFTTGPIMLQLRGTGLNFFLFFFFGWKGLFWTHCKSNIALVVGL